MKPTWRNTALALFTACLLLGGIFGNQVLALTDQTREVLQTYTQLVTLAHENYGQDVSYRNLVSASIQGMLRTLDPHTSFLRVEAYADMRDRQQTSFSGLGILVGMRNGQLTIITPIEGTPAARLGLRAGDHINRIEGEPTETMSLNDAVGQLKGPKGTQVEITIVRRGLEEPLEFTITRDEIPQNSVRYAFMMSPETGYLAISDFNRGTGAEVTAAIKELTEAGMKQLLIDLRNNGGGLLDQSIEVADQFLPGGTKIVETRGRTRDSFQVYNASDNYPTLGIPVIVLVSQGTASAAEILAGAIQDHDVGLIVGSPTWGKGLVQTVYSLSYNNGLALTTAKYYTPSGRLIQRDYSSWFDYATFSNGQVINGDIPETELDAPNIFLTDLGRKVYGGGGITPDILFEDNEIAPFLQYLLSRNSFFDFAVLKASQGLEISRDWEPTDRLLDEFAKWAVSEEIVESEKEFDEGLDDEARELALRYIHSELFNSAFGLEARYKVLAKSDPLIQKALQLFGEATDLLARRQRVIDPAEAKSAVVGQVN
jgi:carboxyl-terminal processing protease